MSIPEDAEELERIGVEATEEERYRRKKRRTSYQIGYIVELKARDELRRLGATHVIRSSRSLTPIDLIAILPQKQEIWLVQCKAKREAPQDPTKLKAQFQELKQLSGTYKVLPVVFMKKNGKYQFIEVS